MKRNIFLLIVLFTFISCEQTSDSDHKKKITKEIVLKNFEHISSGDMDAFQTTISSDFKFILSGTLKWNDGRKLSRTYGRI